MRYFLKKVFVAFGLITLITISVIPLSIYAQADTIGGTPETIADTKAATPTIARVAEAVGNVVAAPIIVTLSPLFYGMMNLAASILGVSGLFLDYIIKISVVDLRENINNISAINNIWRVIRDLANMTFIFILLYEGIRMVLGLGGSGIKKVVTNIIIAAVLVNFSLFFTKIIIDASNIVTLGFYRSIVSAGTTQIAGYDVNFGLTGAFMKALRLSSLYTVSSFANLVLNGIQGMVIFTSNTVFMLVAAFVFAAVAIMFVIRYLSFIILLIMSPFAFVSLAIPGLSDLRSKYFKALTGQALFAPVFMLLTWVLLTLAGDSGFLKSSVTKSFGDAIATPSTDTISLIVDYVLIIGLLIQSLVISKSIATKGGLISTKIIDKGTSYLGGAVFGVAARAGTQTAGRIGRAVADSDSLRKRVEEGGMRGWLSKKALETGKFTADSSFDLRNTGLIGSTMGAGKGLKGGYDSYLKEKKKEDKELLELIKPSDRAVAQAEEMLKGDAFKEREKIEKNKYFASDEYAQIVQAETAKRKKALANAEKDKKESEDNLKAAQEELTKITNDIENSAAYKTIQTRLAAAATNEARKAIQDEIDEQRKPIDIVQSKITTLNKVLSERAKVVTSANKNLVEGLDNWIEAEYTSWISDEQRRLIATKGGQDEKKYTKKENKDLAGQIKTREVTSTVDQYAKTIAERVGNRKSAWMPWGYITENPPEFSKDRGRALKKGIKKKKSVEDTIKEQMKEESEKDEGGDEATPATPTPPPAATPPTP